MLNRELCQLTANRVGFLKAAPTASWEAGMVATLGSTGLDKAGTSSTPIGLFMTNHIEALTRAIYGESHGPIDAAAANGVSTSATLDHQSLVASAYAVYAGATLLTETTDYTINTSTGVITAAASGKLDSVNGTYTNAGVISVNYRYNMTVVEKQGFLDSTGLVVGGPGFDNNFDEALPEGQVTFAGPGNIIFTDQFATEAAWSAPGVAVYADANGRMCLTQTGSEASIGLVVAIPTAQSPWLGVLVR